MYPGSSSFFSRPSRSSVLEWRARGIVHALSTRPAFYFAAALLAAFIALAHYQAVAGIEEEVARLRNEVVGPSVDFSVAGETTWIIPSDRFVVGEGPVEIYLRNFYGGEGSTGPVDQGLPRWSVRVYSAKDGQPPLRLASLGQAVDDEFQLVDEVRSGSPEHWDTCSIAYLSYDGDLHVHVSILEPAARLKGSDIQLGAVPVADNVAGDWIGVIRGFQWGVTVLGLLLLALLCWLHRRATARPPDALSARP